MGRIARLVIAVTVAVFVSVAVSGGAASGEASASREPGTITSREPGTITSYKINGILSGVAATSADNAWAVGMNGSPSGPNGPDGTTLIVHWDGRTWTRVTNPKPAKGYLTSVAALSATDAWAVGGIPGKSLGTTLIMHWDGRSWQRDASAPVVSGRLMAVAASKYGVWAVGVATAGAIGSALILHRVGTRWYVVPTPYPAILDGVVMTGPDSAWADAYKNGAGLLLRWNGKVWRSLPFPVRDYLVQPGDIASGPGGTAMMIGEKLANASDPGTAYSLLFNGKVWRILRAPTAGTSLSAVTFIPGKGAWAVGATRSGPVIMRWNGHAWTSVQSLGDLPYTGLSSINGVSATDAWAVGATQAPDATRPTTIILHWNGHAWS